MIVLGRGKKLQVCLCTGYRSYISTQNAKTATALQKDDNEYNDEPEYPRIRDLSFRARRLQDAESWHKKIEHLRTVEEKLIKINMPRYWGYKVVELRDSMTPYNCLPAIQHYTRTALEKLEVPKIKTAEAETSEQRLMERPDHMDSLVDACKGDFQDALELAYDCYRNRISKLSTPLDPVEAERQLTQLIVEQINRTLINTLSGDYPHLHEAEIDYNPRHEASWSVGGIDPPKNVIKSKKGTKWQKEFANDPIERLMQYVGSPYLTLRHNNQLTPWKTIEESSNLELAKTIPRYQFDPRTLGYLTGYRHVTNIPGYWPNSNISFGCISYQSRAHLLERPSTYTPRDFQEALYAQAIQSSYAWLMAEANYNGFNTYSELTYPMNTQTIITNGRDWSFYEYQLNTLLVHNNHIDTNPSLNFCRGTKELQMYHGFSDDGKLLGFNEEVLRMLIKFYTNVPSVIRNEKELQPFLDSDVPRVAAYSDDEKRDFLEKTFKHMSSNRPRHLEKPEIYLWEKIYKIDNNLRVMEPRRRFFELNINPWKRRMDQHDKEYVPKCLQPEEGLKKFKKWKKTYYP